MKILKSLSILLLFVSLISFCQCVWLYVDTILSSAKTLTLENADPLFFRLFGIWILLIVSVALANRFIEHSGEQNPLESLLRFCPFWMRLAFRWGFFCGLIHTVLFFVMGILVLGNSNLWDIWRLRGMLGFEMTFYLWSAILFYAICVSKRTTF